MQKLIFLDFDGVLHVEGGKTFARLPVFEHYLEQMPDVQIVISSTWREVQPLAKLVLPFRPGVRERIIGVTPVLETGARYAPRQREIEACLQQMHLGPHNASWIAIDDTAYYFEDRCPWLMLTNRAQGFEDHHGRALLAWHRAGAAPTH